MTIVKLNSMEDFQRDISYRLLKREDGTIALTATLRDRFHDIELQVLADSGSLEITHVQADFRKCPTGSCKNVSLRLQKLVGFVIGRGLNRN
jgi:hypothetical protein